jgi:hypothetical protein
MPKRKEPELDPKEQFKRFQEAAKDRGVDKAAEKIERDFTDLSRHRRPARQTSKKAGS